MALARFGNLFRPEATAVIDSERHELLLGIFFWREARRNQAADRRGIQGGIILP